MNLASGFQLLKAQTILLLEEQEQFPLKQRKSPDISKSTNHGGETLFVKTERNIV